MSAGSTASLGLMGAASLLAMTWASGALAQGADVPAQASQTAGAGDSAFSEIVVTAQKRTESIQRVPISITAMSGDELAQRQIRGASDLATGVPSLQVNNALGEGLPIFSLRGISMLDFSLAQNGPIAVYYDEVYKGNFAIMGLGMFDLERVEVLKGPQGTLYGKNTTGGAVNLITRKPSFETGGYLSLGYGNYDRITTDGAVEAALSDTLGARVAYTFERADGWMKNAYPGAPDGNAVRQYGIRGSVRYNPNDIVDITIRAATTLQNPWNYGIVAIPTAEGIGGEFFKAFGLTPDFRTGLGKREFNTPDITRRRLRTYSLAANADFQLSDAITLTSITSWDRGTISYTEDGDGTPVFTTDVDYYGKTKQITQDLRLTSSLEGPFNFIVGGYFSSEKVNSFNSINYFSQIDFNGDGGVDGQDCLDGGGFIACNVYNEFNQKKTSFAAYSDVTFDLDDQFTLRGGLRYTHDRGKLRDFMAQIRAPDGTPLINTIPGSETDLFATTSRDFKNNNVSGKIGIDYKPTDRVLLYASYSRGYRGAAFNAQALYAPVELSVAKPEKLQAAEAGFKTELFNRRVRLNGAAFWYGYKNQQVFDIDPQTQVQRLLNLPKSRIFGGELDLQVRATEYLTLSTGIGLIDTKVLQGTVQGENVRGNRLVSAPSFTLTSSVDWMVPIGAWGAADARVDLSYASKQHYDILNRETTTEGGYALVNSRVRFHPENDRYGVAFWVKNLTNTFYRTNKIDASGLGFIYTHVNPPRTYGVTVDMKF
ncbi:MAG: TonB-dependent receptor [Sphingomonadaceae bacterium]